MLSSVISPDVNYDESNWAVSIVWDPRLHGTKRIMIECETSSQSLFIQLCFSLMQNNGSVYFSESRLGKDDKRGREMLFFYNYIDEFSPACKTFIVDKQTVLTLINQYNKGEESAGSISTSGHLEDVQIRSFFTPTNMSKEEWFAYIFSTLEITVPDTYQDFSRLDGITMHKGCIAAMPQFPKCAIL